MKKKIFAAFLIFVMVLLAIIPQRTDGAAKTKLSKSKATMEVDSKLTLKLENAGDGKITWISGNKKIASITSKGTVTAKSEGTVRVAAKQNGKKYVCTITVVDSNKEVTPTPTPTPTMKDVEIYFDKESIKLTSKDEVQTVYFCMKLNGYSGEIETPTVDAYGTGDVNVEVGELETDSDVFKIPFIFSAIENGTIYIEYSFSEKQKAMLEIIVDTPENIIYEDEYVKICFIRIGESGVEFLVENKTDYVLTIQADTVSINGYSTNDIVMSDDIAPKSKGKAIARCDDFEEGMKVEKISGQLSVIDFSDELLKRSYNVKFIDFEIE